MVPAASPCAAAFPEPGVELFVLRTNFLSPVTCNVPENVATAELVRFPLTVVLELIVVVVPASVLLAVVENLPLIAVFAGTELKILFTLTLLLAGVPCGSLTTKKRSSELMLVIADNADTFLSAIIISSYYAETVIVPQAVPCAEEITRSAFPPPIVSTIVPLFSATL